MMLENPAQDDLVAEWVHLQHQETSQFKEVYGFAGSQGTVNLEGVRTMPRGSQGPPTESAHAPQQPAHHPSEPFRAPPPRWGGAPARCPRRHRRIAAQEGPRPTLGRSP